MEVPIIKIGKCRGLRISKKLLKQCNTKDEVELMLEKGRIIIWPLFMAKFL